MSLATIIAGTLTLMASHLVLGYNVVCNEDTQVYPFQVSSRPCYSSPFKRIVFFGDSWTENGEGPLDSNSYDTSNFRGRQTNGPTWAEYLTKMMGADTLDYAFSGASANNDIVPRSVPDTGQQITMYQQPGTVQGGGAEPSLHFIWTGVNDIHDIFVNTTSEAERYAKMEGIIASLEDQMEQLFYESNTRYFVIMGLAPINRLPLFRNLSFADKLSLTNLIAAYNSQLRSLAPQFTESRTMTLSYKDMGDLRVASQAGDDDVKILFFNVHKMFQDKLLSKAESLGIVNVADACKSNIQQCSSSQQRYLWWDDWHPTTYVHQLIASMITKTLLS